MAQRLKWKYQTRLKRLLRFVEILTNVPQPAGPRTPSSEVTREETIRLVHEALERLEPADRQMIEWRVFEKLRFKEIGRRLGYSAPYAQRMWLVAKSRFESDYGDAGKALSR